jgi:hypothetical protein
LSDAQREGQIEAALAAIRAKYGRELDPAELARVRRDLARVFDHAAELRAVPLANWDEPDFTFAVHDEVWPK